MLSACYARLGSELSGLKLQAMQLNMMRNYSLLKKGLIESK